MNERIRELAEQSEITQYVAAHNKYLERFAELIVRACSNIAAHHNSLDAAEDIMKHFGVEE